MPQLTFKKKGKKNKTMKVPIKLTFGDANSTSVYNSSNTYLVPWTEMEPHTAIATQPEKVTEKDVDKKRLEGK